MSDIPRLVTFTLCNRPMLDKAKVDIRGARNPELIQAIHAVALAAGVVALSVGRFGVSGQLPLAQFAELFGFEPEAGKGYSLPARLPGDSHHVADVVQVSPPLEPF